MLNGLDVQALRKHYIKQDTTSTHNYFKWDASERHCVYNLSCVGPSSLTWTEPHKENCPLSDQSNILLQRILSMHSKEIGSQHSGKPNRTKMTQCFANFLYFTLLSLAVQCYCSACWTAPTLQSPATSSFSVHTHTPTSQHLHTQ